MFHPIFQRLAQKFMILATLGCLVIGWTTISEAGIALTTPAGLNPGDQFQFVFLTHDSTNAINSDITYYNNFVNSDAAGATYSGMTVTWLAIVSTATVNAISQTGDANIPVYTVDGMEVASSTTTAPGGLWSGSLLNYIRLSIDGSQNVAPVWTGTNAQGTQDGPYYLGNTTTTSPNGPIATQGRAGNTDSSWITFGVVNEPTRVPAYFYGISTVLTVPSSVPEPSTILPMAMGMTTLLLQRGLRRWKSHRG